ncbi:MAG: LysM peptidoglycan-binding domain-containing protein [Thermoguttaceae bacterium]
MFRNQAACPAPAVADQSSKTPPVEKATTGPAAAPLRVTIVKPNGPAGALPPVVQERVASDRLAKPLRGKPIEAVRPGSLPSKSPLRRHRIVDGDTLTGLAERLLGSSERAKEIFAANRDVLDDPNLLPIGVELKIPSR